jgi:hypothetical protein
LLVFLAGRPGKPPGLWLRALDGSGTYELPSTSGARSPFWSPDSRRVGFFADGKVHRVEIETRQVRTVGAVPGSEGGAWAADGTILGGRASGGLWRIATDTNTPVDLLPPNASLGQQSLISPWFLPGERRFLYLSLPDRGVWLGTLDGGTPEKLVWADSPAMFASGAIVFVRQQTLYAQRFDARGRALAGEPVVIARNVYQQHARAAFSISHTGLLVYRGGADAPDPWLTLISNWTSLMGR